MPDERYADSAVTARSRCGLATQRSARSSQSIEVPRNSTGRGESRGSRPCCISIPSDHIREPRRWSCPRTFPLEGHRARNVDPPDRTPCGAGTERRAVLRQRLRRWCDRHGGSRRLRRAFRPADLEDDSDDGVKSGGRRETCPPGLTALREASGSNIAGLGHTVPCAIGYVVTLWGAEIVAGIHFVHRWVERRRRRQVREKARRNGIVPTRRAQKNGPRRERRRSWRTGGG